MCFRPTAGNRTDEHAVAELIALFRGTGSVLLRHEVAYTLGQMRRLDAVPFLEEMLADGAEHPITRHEAAEALGAIEAPESLNILARHAADAASEVSDTCGLALRLLDYQIAKGACGCERRPHEALREEALREEAAASKAAASKAAASEAAAEASTGGTDVGAPTAPDPTADADSCSWRPPEPPPLYDYVSPAPAAKPAPVGVHRAHLLDRGLPIFERYRALFALRDAVPKEGEAPISALCEALNDRQDSAPPLEHTVASPSPSPCTPPPTHTHTQARQRAAQA